jgi:4-oxalocrotonate tautomerase
MPLITVEGPPVPVETKRKLVEGLTKAAIEAYGIPEIIVLIKENPPDCVGLNGELLCDRRKAEKEE